MPTILLTGANGFLGSHLLRALLLRGYKVVILKRSTSDVWRIKDIIGLTKSYDVDKKGVATAFIEQPIDIVVHTACHYGRNDSSLSSIIESNVLFGLQILEASQKYKTALFINTGTLLHKTLNAYALSKAHFLEWLRTNRSDMQVVNLKLEHMYGEDDDTSKLVPWVLSEIRADADEIKLTKGEQQRDFVHVDDVIAAFLLILDKASALPKFSEFDVGSGQLVSVKNFIEKLYSFYEEEFGNSNTKLKFGDVPYREGEVMKAVLDIGPLNNLGWDVKVDLDTGLRRVVSQKEWDRSVASTRSSD